jgi:hypothetical protein
MVCRPSSVRLFLTGASLGSLGAILRTALFAIRNADGIQRSTNNVITNSRQILHTPAANKHDRVLLKIVSHARNISRHLDTIRQANTRYLAQGRVRFLGSLRVDTSTNAALLRRTLQRGARRFIFDVLASLANELVYRRHFFLFPFEIACDRAQKGISRLFPERLPHARHPMGVIARPAVSAGGCPATKNIN